MSAASEGLLARRLEARERICDRWDAVSECRGARAADTEEAIMATVVSSSLGEA
eukprot:CAMPEP_0173404608 /NCGR_PEP_ID=MMETSP1356-20130122/59799_1 /TAXON_ID=77927 ORGANISM="Hemiselmis virescens, Strain PCC157" /NCGR_SAMPLE_ID=MMETSP1356 /ASSEMBLY_ACC=CAM_ASM_000847 /LENGTH=53 /DNA_ID=CAMNT_0014365307 /DNA_START=146 /DNA_END=304 /DNA_ORIENTATION=-